MLSFFLKFKADEDGAVTVDWVVLTAGVVILAVVTVNEIRTGNNVLAAETSQYLERQDVSNGPNIQDAN